MQRFEFLLLLASLGHAHVLRPLPQTNSSVWQKRADGYDSVVVHIDANADNHYENFYHFVTRPDIDAPRWNIKKYNETAIAPGYWFTAPYQDPFQIRRGGGWVGPHIYDQDGELIWSGVPMLSGFDTFDFKVSRFNNEDMLSMIYRHESGIFMNSQYEIEKGFDITDEVGELNMHDFSTTGDGETVLMLKTKTNKASEEILEAAGLEYECRAHWYGFEEVNATTGDALFSWWSEGKIGLEETFFAREPKRACHQDGGLDCIHANAVEKFPDGDYLFSGRHCNTIYKISSQDGSIVWRFGGRKSDFKWDGHFTGQHHTRVQSQNSTHTVISFLDNAYLPGGHPVYSSDYSRGFLVALRTDRHHKTAETVAQFNHPHGGYAPGRGSVQILPNGNTFIGWTSYALHTEYDVNGNLIMEASLRPELQSYRSYKFEWIGRPSEPPSVRSIAVETDHNSTITTSVHASWNGATEVSRWNLYKTTSNGEYEQLLTSAPRKGFETTIPWSGYAGYVVLEAIDRHGEALGRSEITETIKPINVFNSAIVEEERWQQNPAPEESQELMFGSPISLGNFGLAFAFGVVCCVVGVCAGVLLWQSRKVMRLGGSSWSSMSQSYEKVQEVEDGDETLVTKNGDNDDTDKVEYEYDL